MKVEYKINEDLGLVEFRDLLRASTLAARRPVDNDACLAGMLAHANLLVTARDGGRLVGVARSLTDHHYCCYLSDLAVDVAFQKQGIGRELIRKTLAALKPTCRLILLSAPAAEDYYPHLGFERHSSAWTLAPAELRAPDPGQ